MDQANALAYVALLLTFPASIAAFAMLKSVDAVVVILLGAMLFLPAALVMRVPTLSLDKDSIPVLCVLIGLFFWDRRRFAEARLGRPADWLMLGALVAPFGTVFANADVLDYGAVVLPALDYKDLFAEMMRAVTSLVGPYLIGRVAFRTDDDAKTLLRGLAIGGLIYVPFILIELKMSPQFHVWVYGYHPHDFSQSVRAGGYRPVVFLNHGLTLAMFMWTATVATWLLKKLGEPVRGRPAGPFALLQTVLFPFLKSAAATAYLIVTVPLIWFGKPRLQLRFGLVIAVFVCTYPLVRANPAFPADDILDVATRYAGADRAGSLEFRFQQETLLLEHSAERPWFGWGGWGRSNIYSEEGKPLTVPDGEWIIRLNAYGWVGFLTAFALILAPLFVAFRTTEGTPGRQRLIGAFALLVAVRALDLLPNSGMQTGLYFAGALAGLSYGAGESSESRLNPGVVLALLQYLRKRKAHQYAGPQLASDVRGSTT